MMACAISAAGWQTPSEAEGAAGARGEGSRESSFGEAEPTPSTALPQSCLWLWGKNFINNDEKHKHGQTSALGTRREHPSQYLRGIHLAGVASTCRKPFCPCLLEVLSHSRTPAAPARDQAHGGLQPAPLLPRAAAPIADALQRERNLNFWPGAWWRGAKCVCASYLIHEQTSPRPNPILSWLERQRLAPAPFGWNRNPSPSPIPVITPQPLRKRQQLETLPTSLI